jgi:glucose/arabinose dehydrogenase
MRRVRAGLAGLAMVLVGCGHGGASPVPTAPPGSTAPPLPSVSPSSSVSPRVGTRVRLEQVANLKDPIAIAVRPDDPSLYIAEQGGAIVALRPGTRSAPQTILDLTGQIVSGGEQGLLGLTFSPDGRWLYASFTDRNGNSNLVAYRFAGGAVQGVGRRILLVDQPTSIHNGGDIAFGPDGMLYLGLGDGGGEGDPNGTGQRIDTLLGKIVRIEATPAGSSPYAIPRSNPFVGRAGVRPEIWAFGLRNPWRFSFDRATGDLWIGDVGQGNWEEVDEQSALSRGGRNYGWSCYEGDHPFGSCRPPDIVMPVYEYDHVSSGCAIIGGYVYRGSAIPALRGAYVFGDYCAGRLMALASAGDGARAWPLGPKVTGLDSFGQDSSGELYALSSGGGVFRLTP